MIEYDGKPILLHNILLLKKFGVTDIFINTHHLSELIVDYFKDGKRFDVNVNYSFEDTLLGTSGALNNFKEHLQNEPFFVLYGDNISDYSIQLLIDKYLQNDTLAVIGFHYREDVSHSGVAEFDAQNTIIRFIEKPLPGQTDSHWVNAGIYLLNPEILNFIPAGVSDFARDIFPHLIDKGFKLYGVCADSQVKAFDTPDMYRSNINNSGDNND